MISTIKAFLLVGLITGFAGCYSFKDVSIPPEVKTVKINFIENRARYVNPQLAPQLTERLRQKVISQTRLTMIQGDDAHYIISATITDYSVTTSGIQNQTTATNRLNVSVAIMFENKLDETKSYKDPVTITRNFDFNANLALPQAESQLNETMIRNLSDEIFNRIFSNW
ncbi:LPS assembly lipoprotein LptE [Flavihumibacter petaseus]|uniref:Lipoprotein n=1 Tax=Flavihumibacter petaseus NBRC 106054 TaxID=1220578 RepID=A0A0E9N3L9_9BACT|nr:LPS assembly lipoprotein LptE [Flavihumibacter petaseus]GAO44373.1 hypothetical protein FPE01S_03_04110 [Flavihumibacter petaseus NBRC 106054]